MIRKAIVCLGVVAAFAATGWAGEDPEPAANVVIVHALEGEEGTPVDVLVNDMTCLMGALTFGDVVGPTPLPPGTYNLKVSAADKAKPCSGTPILDATVELTGGSISSIVAYPDSRGNPTLGLFDTDPGDLSPEDGLISLHHVAAGSAVDVTFTAVEDDGGNGEEPTKGGDGDGDGDDSGAVCLCHIPPGNPDAAHTICVGPKAVAAHLAHGDTEGECDDSGGSEEVTVRNLRNGTQRQGNLAVGGWDMVVTPRGGEAGPSNQIDVAAGVIHFIYLAGDTSMTVVILQAELGMGMPIAPLLQPQDGPQRPRRGRGADRIPGNPF